MVAAASGHRGLSLAFSAPILDESGKVVRVWSNRASWDRIVGPILAEIREDAKALGIPSLRAQVLARTGLVLDDADVDSVLSTNLAELGLEAARPSGEGATGFTLEPSGPNGAEEVNGFADSRGALGFAGYGWRVLTRADLDAAAAGARSGGMLLLGLLVLSAIVITALALWIARATAQPLAAVAATLKQISAGELDVSVEVHSQDEIGQVEEATRAMVASLREVITQVSLGSDQITTASRELSGAAEQLASGAQHQAASLEQTTASLEQIAATVKQNADNARTANQLASGSRDTAEKGGEVVGTAVTAMADINQSSKRIADITTTIDEIAFQTNLLALNAAVEAARAGEQGRGFAVVASEVRSLAQRSAVAAREIKELIQDSVAKIENGAGRVQRSGETLQEIVTSVKRVTDIVGEISAASQEQSTEIHQVTKSVAQMDRVVQSNSAQTEELSATAQALATQAEQLQEVVRRFHLGGSGGPDLAASPISSVSVQAISSRPAPRSFFAGAAAAPPPRPFTPDGEEMIPAAPPPGRNLPAASLAIDDSFEEF